MDGSVTAKTDSDIMRLVRERYDAAVDADRTNRLNDESDRKFYAGGENQWDSTALKERRDDGRPCETFNRLPQFVKQVSGEVRQNKPAIKVLPVDGQTDPDMADVYSAIIRHVEGNSDAHRIYARETEKACIGGAGWLRIKSDYCDGDSFDQELLIEAIPNPNAVVCDPDARHPTRSDMTYCFVTELVSKEAFKKKYPKASESDFGEGDWLEGDFVRIAEYWEKSEGPAKTIYALEGPAGVEVHPEDDVRQMLAGEGGDPVSGSIEDHLQGLPITVKSKRKVPSVKVRSRLICGSMPLTDWQDWPGKHIPFVRFVGEEIETGDMVVRHGLIRHARPAQMAYNYARNAMMERHATSTKAPWLIALKQIPAAFKGMWETAHRKNWAVLPYDPIAGVPPPQRIAPPAIDAAAYQESMVASEDMKATTGIYDAALGAKSNETSGVAIARRDAQGDTATYVYIDNMEAAITVVGRILIDLIPEYYSDERIIRMLGEDGEVEKFVQINKMLPDGKTWNDVTRGKYDLVVSTGPAYASKRQEAAQMLLDLVGKFPPLAQIGGDIIIRSLDLPNGDKLADRFQKTLPPGMDEDADKSRQEQQGQQQQPDPAHAQMQAQMQAEQQKQQMTAQVALQEAQIKAQTAIEVAKIDAETKLMIAGMQAPVELHAGGQEMQPEAMEQPSPMDQQMDAQGAA